MMVITDSRFICGSKLKGKFPVSQYQIYVRTLTFKTSACFDQISKAVTV